MMGFTDFCFPFSGFDTYLLLPFVQVTDPILDGSFFLDAAHKMQLKDEFSK